MIDRRNFLKGAAATLALSGYPLIGTAQPKISGNIIVIILEGGLDGLGAVPAVGDPNLSKLRRKLIHPKSIRLNDLFYLHPSLGVYSSMLRKGEACIVHATNFPYVKRSHFEGQNVVESGNMTPFADKTGWLGRALDLIGSGGKALSIDMPLIIRGVNNIDNYYPASIRGSKEPDLELAAQLAALRPNTEGAGALKKIVDKYKSPPSFVARDPTALALHAGRSLGAPNGPSVAVLRVREFDTHAQQGNEFGTFARQLAELDTIFDSLKRGLGSAWKDSIILTQTEFGRTVRVNGAEGTEHGYGSVGLLAGGLLSRSNIVAKWPGLSNRELFEERDLMSTIDYRSVCSACIEKAFGIDHDAVSRQVFYTNELERLTDVIFG